MLILAFFNRSSILFFAVAAADIARVIEDSQFLSFWKIPLISKKIRLVLCGPIFCFKSSVKDGREAVSAVVVLKVLWLTRDFSK